MRTEAQKAADRRYREKIKEKQAIVQFRCTKEEAERIEEIIKSSGFSKINFLRKSIQYYLRNKEQWSKD